MLNNTVKAIFVSLIVPVLLFPARLAGQEEAPIKTANHSPYHVIYNHLYYLQPENYEPFQSALSFPGTDSVASRNNAIKLKQILDGRGLYVNIDQVPAARNYVDTNTQKAIFKPFPRQAPHIYVERIGEDWFYSQETVKAIPTLFKEVYPLGSDLFLKILNPAWDGEFLDIKVWQWLGMLILLIVAFIAHRLAAMVLNLIITWISNSRIGKGILKKELSLKTARAFSLFLMVLLLTLFVPALQLKPKLSQYVIISLKAFSTVFAIIFVLRVIDIVIVYFERITARTESTMDDQLLPVMRKMVKVLVVLAGSIYVLSLLRVNVTALIAGISIGGIALALAAQDTVKNFIGSIMIFVDRPFQIGDWINYQGIDGIVEEVGVRSTRVRTFANSLTYIPNGKLADSVIDNLGLRVYRRYKTEIGITYDTPPHLIEAFVKGIRELIKAHPSTRKDYYEVHLNSFGAHSLNILLYSFFKAPNWSEELEGRHNLMLSIIYLAHDLGVRFAFPTSTLHIEEMPGTTSLSPSYIKTREEAEKMMEASLRKAYKQYGLEDTSHKFKPLGGDQD